MRPLHLSIEGLTVFRSPQEIDFNELDLFVITGPTGAGKSSILDAITLALYGDVCRVKSGELRELISHGATHVKVALDFRIDSTTYRVARRLKKVGQGHAVHFVRLDGDVETAVSDASGIKAINGSIEQVLGLDFSSFTKAVLLPQGAFHEFLKGDANARRQILIRLLDLDRYLRIGVQARNRAKLLEAQIKAQQDVLESEYGDATTEALTAAKEAEKKAKAAYERLSATEEKTKGLIATVEHAQSVAAQAASATETFQEVQAELDDYAAQVTPLAETLESRRQEVVAADAAVSAAKKQLSTATATLDQLTSKLGDEAAISGLQSAAQTRKRETETLAGLETELGLAKEAVAEAKAKQGDARKAVKGAETVLQRAQYECEEAKALLELAQASEEAQTTQTALEKATTARDAALGELEAAKVHLAHLERSDLAATLRQGLKPGDRCPVCERTIATLPKAATTTGSALKKAKEALARVEKKRVAAEQTLSSAKTLNGAATTRLEQAAVALPAKADRLATAEVEQLLAKREETLTLATGAKTAAETALADSAVPLETQKTRVNGLQQQLTAANKRLRPAETALRGAFPTKLPKDLEEQLAARLQQVKDARDAQTAAAIGAAEAERAAGEAAAARREIENELADLATQLAKTRTRAEACVQALENAATVTLSPLPPAKGELPAQLTETAQAMPAYTRAADEAVAAANETQGNALRELAKVLEPLGLTLPDTTGDLTPVLQAAVREAHTDAAAARSATTLLKDRLKRKKELEAEVGESSVTCARYRALGQELHRDNFIAFVLAESMERLAAMASVELLRISDDRYSLVADSDGFDVVDHQNADERRSVATLSGGETFLASLALALALAGSVRDLGGSTAAARLDAMFIDEGFGALDLETLEVVLDALERLREGERMVGVISHVDELAQRIPQGLTVTKTGASSTVSAR